MYADAVLEELEGSKLFMANIIGMYSLPLGKAIACYQSKQYQLGLNYLGTAFEIRKEPENTDSKYLCFGEALVILGLYKQLDGSHGLDFSMIPSPLRDVSPGGLVSKGLKLCIGVSRVPDLITRGWADLMYNLHMMSTTFKVATFTIPILKDFAKIPEFRHHTADLIYFSQQMGIVSRSIQMLIPAAELDLVSRRFESCYLKIIALDKMMKDGCREVVTFNGNSYKELAVKLNIEASIVKELSEVPHFSWRLNNVKLPDHHYPRGHPETIFEPATLMVPAFLEHSLGCHCYLCTNATVLSDAFNSLNIQARFAVCSNNILLSTKLTRLVKHHHQRSMFRLLLNIKPLTEDFNEKDINVPALYEASFSAFFLKPRIQSINTQMECSSSTELRFIANSMNDSLAASKILNKNNFWQSYIPIEIMMSAMLNTMCNATQVSSSTKQELRKRLNSTGQIGRQVSFHTEVKSVTSQEYRINYEGSSSCTTLDSLSEDKTTYLLTTDTL